MKREVLQRQLAWGLLCLLTCCGCSRFKKEVAAPNGFGLLHRNVESTTLPPVQQVNHDQLIKPVALEEKKKETAGQFLERQFDWMIGRGKSRPASIRLLADAEQIYNRATNARATGNGVTSDDEIQRLYLEAAKVYDRSAKRWSDSALHEDALFMAAESYFFGHRYPEADERYERLLKDYPKSRYLDQIQRRRFSIAHYWLKMDQLDHQQFYEFNLMDPTVPWRDQFNYGVRILDQIRLDDPTGDIADDATLLAADACLELGRYQQADNLYSDLIKAFPSSEHQFRPSFQILDFNIEISIRGFKKVLAKKSDVNNIFFWASFINLNIFQPDLNKTFMNDNLKNVIKKSIPAQIENINDWYKFYVATYELFDGYSLNVSSPNNEWIKKTNDADSFKKNIQSINKLIEKLK